MLRTPLGPAARQRAAKAVGSLSKIVLWCIAPCLSFTRLELPLFLASRLDDQKSDENLAGRLEAPPGDSSGTCAKARQTRGTQDETSRREARQKSPQERRRSGRDAGARIARASAGGGLGRRHWDALVPLRAARARTARQSLVLRALSSGRRLSCRIVAACRDAPRLQADHRRIRRRHADESARRPVRLRGRLSRAVKA